MSVKFRKSTRRPFRRETPEQVRERLRNSKRNKVAGSVYWREQIAKHMAQGQEAKP